MPGKTEKTVALLDEWLIAEEDTIAMAKKITRTTDNPAIRIFMDIIRADSIKHKFIQRYLKEALTEKAPALSFDEIARISDMIHDHLELEQKTVDWGYMLCGSVRMPILKELFAYLLDDERKHVVLLNALTSLKDAVTRNT